MMRKTMTAMAVMALMATTAATAQQSTRPGQNDPRQSMRGPGLGHSGMGGRGMGGPGMGGMGNPAKRFAMIDADHDGSISRAEFEAFHARMRREGPPGMGGGGGRGQEGRVPYGGQSGMQRPQGQMPNR